MTPETTAHVRKMNRRRGLTPDNKQAAVLRCQEIESALHSLLDVLNGTAYSADLDRVIKLEREVQRLRFRFEDYRELIVMKNTLNVSQGESA